MTNSKISATQTQQLSNCQQKIPLDTYRLNQALRQTSTPAQKAHTEIQEASTKS